MHSFRRKLLLFSIVAIITSFTAALSGCESAGDANRVDPALARSTLETVLNSWHRGESIDLWQMKDSPVVAQDLDWKAGVKLASFEIMGHGDAVDANMFCPVKLLLEDASSQRFERKVTYVVGTTPVCTVFRSLTP